MNPWFVQLHPKFSAICSSRPSPDPMWRRRWLIAFLASVAINAVLGIWALVSNDFGPTQEKILATSFCVSGAMLGVLVNGPAAGRRVRWPAPAVGAISAATGFLLLIAVVWAELDSIWWGKTIASLLMSAAGATLIGLIGLLALRPHYESLRMIHNAATVVLVASAIAALWAEIDADWVIRAIGVESIVVAALTLVVPALARYRPSKQRPTDRTATVVICPRCGTQIDVPNGSAPPPRAEAAATVDQPMR